jgi:hypothetical protein
MTETIRRVRLSNASECKARAKHESVRNHKHINTLAEIAIALNRMMSDGLDECRPLGYLRGELSDGITTRLGPRLEVSGSLTAYTKRKSATGAGVNNKA